MDWQPYVLPQPFIFSHDSTVLDIGCGIGNQLAECSGRLKIGVEPDSRFASQCHKRGYLTLRAQAERLPFANASFDGIICKVVLPLTIEDQAVNEIARVLKANGKCYLITIGCGYYIRYLLLSRSLAFRFYGLRTLINTWWWSLTHLRLPGFVGDTTYQSHHRLRRYFASNRLILITERTTTFLGLPVFIYCELRREPK